MQRSDLLAPWLSDSLIAGGSLAAVVGVALLTALAWQPLAGVATGLLLLGVLVALVGYLAR